MFKKITIEFSFNYNRMTHFRKIMALSVVKNTTKRALNLEKKKVKYEIKRINCFSLKLCKKIMKIIEFLSFKSSNQILITKRKRKNLIITEQNFKSF
jgi:hypothetical protein